jgi:biopolymer transport protein ExbD/biopolymer transport protein TolR
MAMDLAVGGPKRRVTPSMNVTPLVDVVLVLLIIFMVITPMMVKKLWVHVPKKEETKAATPDVPDPNDVPVVVTVHQDGTVWINKDQVAINQLGPKLERIFAARADTVIFFDAEDGVPYGAAMRVLDEARGGGAVNIAVLTESVVH